MPPPQGTAGEPRRRRGACAADREARGFAGVRRNMKTFVIYYKYHVEGEKNPGPVRHYKLQADDERQAEQLLRRFANYKGLEVLRIERVA